MRLTYGSDRGDIVVGWLTRIVLVLAACGVVAYDVVSIGVARTQVSDHASSAAIDAADAWSHTHDVQQALAAAVATATADRDTLRPQDFSIAQDGTVTLRLCRTATTLLAFRTPTSKKWTVQCGSGRARSVDS